MKNQYTQQDLKLAYQIVTQDLFNSLTHLKSGESLRFGSLGKFIKKEQKTKSALIKDKFNQPSTFIYYRLNFKPFGKLKTAFDKQIINKYGLNS